MKFRYVIWALLLLPTSLSWAQSVADLNKQQQAEQRKKTLQKQIAKVESQIEAQEADKKDILDRLKDSEQSISKINAKIDQLSTQQQQAQAQITALQHKAKLQQQALEESRQDLADQLYIQYTSDLSPWSALLSGHDAQKIGRDLGYLGYVSKARVQAVKDYKEQIRKIKVTETSIAQEQQKLSKLAKETSAQKASLQKVQDQYQNDLRVAEKKLKQRRSEAQVLGQDQKRLDQLLNAITQNIKTQEAARQQEIARQKALQARQQQLQAQQAAQARERQRQEQLAQAQRHKAEELQKKAQAARERALAQQKQQQQALQQARNQLGLAMNSAEEELAKKRIQEALAQQSATQAQLKSALKQSENAEIEKAKARIARQKAIRAAELERQAVADQALAQQSASSSGLNKGAPWPLRGELQSRFGAPRAETGGVWRGILIAANSGAPVKAVAGGKVVYANWMRGFGNLIIIDHGNGYLSVYGYNQSLSKSVGDNVSVGQTIARVGSSGGQVEPALYFEIRKGSQAVDPLTLLSK
ncbi:peptidoglycan DD-metalloendopeptidase family protein [Brackiella oedipodis]|uniref:peptidoglycan DD-metalloendopeptidase family protein n=1 Tax=Brackiella oedipodis TaxID=124225 RepID=UPI00048FB7A3|nr:peptidoglycan DD-metalloendopeptidase family protein [Brackiella oedipodis]